MGGITDRGLVSSDLLLGVLCSPACFIHGHVALLLIGVCVLLFLMITGHTCLTLEGECARRQNLEDLLLKLT